MNILQQAVGKVINFIIPHYIIREAFKDKLPNYRAAPVSIDELVMTRVIRPRVMVDLDVKGGQIMVVDTDGVMPAYVDMRTSIFELPAEKFMYRTMLSVLSASFIPYAVSFNNNNTPAYFMPSGNNSDLLSAAQRVGNSMSNIQPLSTSDVEIIGYNTILIRQNIRSTGIYSVRVLVGNEENLNNLPIKMLPQITKLCELAIKAYIYREMIINMDQGFNAGGQIIGTVKNIVETYADANEMYETYLKEEIGGAAHLADPTRKRRFLKLSISPGL